MNQTSEAPLALKKPTKAATHTVGKVSYPDKAQVRWNWPKSTGTLAQVIGATKTKFLIRYVVKTARLNGRSSTAVLRAQVYPQSIQAVQS